MCCYVSILIWDTLLCTHVRYAARQFRDENICSVHKTFAFTSSLAACAMWYTLSAKWVFMFHNFNHKTFRCSPKKCLTWHSWNFALIARQRCTMAKSDNSIFAVNYSTPKSQLAGNRVIQQAHHHCFALDSHWTLPPRASWTVNSKLQVIIKKRRFGGV